MAPGLSSADDRSVPIRADGDRVVVAGLGHVGLAFAHDAVRAGHRTVGLAPERDRIVRLIDELAPNDPPTAVLREALGSGQWRVTDDPAATGPFDVAVVAPVCGAAGAAEPEAVERAAAALAPHLRRGALVVLATTDRPAPRGELLAATIALLTGLRAGPDYALGIGLPHPGTGGHDGAVPTVISGVDAPSARRTADFLHGLGRASSIVSPVSAAELVALLQRAMRVGS